MCGNSCLTREEAKHKYHCGGHCQVGILNLHFITFNHFKMNRENPNHVDQKRRPFVRSTTSSVAGTLV